MDSAVLTVLQADDRYTVTLETPRKGPMALTGTVWVGHEHRQDIVRIVDAVTTLIDRQAGSASPYRGDVSAMSDVCEVGSLEEFGQLMYGLFLPPIIQNALRELDVSLVISTNDCQIPWELLHDGQTFLGLRAPITRRLMVTRWVAGNESPVPAEPTFLIISNPLGDLPDADQEADELMALLDARGIAYDLLRGPRATYIGVQQALVSGRYEAIHYTGHAFFDNNHPDRSGLHLAGGRNLPASQIEGILRGRPIVFLNACSSARQGEAQEPGWEVGYTGPQAEGLASAFVSGGAAGFLGAQWPIFDAGSRDFSKSFYTALLNGASTGEAMQAARAGVRERRPNDATWASFIFYGDPALRIAETGEEMLGRAERSFAAGKWDDALAVTEQVTRRGPSPDADALAQRVAAAQAEKARLDGLYADGMAAYRAGEWQKAADSLAPVVAAEAGYADAQATLVDARQQIELAGMLAQARQQTAKRQWRAALSTLLRLHSQAPDYAGAAGLMEQVEERVAAEHQPPALPRGMLAGLGGVIVVLAVVALYGLWRAFGMPAATPTPTAIPTPTATPAPTTPPSPTTVIVIYVTPEPSPSPTPAPTPTRPPGWMRLDSLGGATVRSVAVEIAGTGIYLGTWGGGVMRSTDDGKSWQAANVGLTNQHIWSVVTDPMSPTIVYAGTNGAGLFRSDDRGLTWQRSTSGIESGYVYALTAVAESNKTRLWAGTGQGRVYYSDDGARTWKATPSQPAAGYINGFYAVPTWPGRVGRLYIATNVGVFVTLDEGVTWKELPMRAGESKPDTRVVVGDVRNDQAVYAGVAGEGVYRTRDGGQTWTLINQGMDNVRVRAMAVDPLDSQQLYVGTDGGRVFRSSNGGDRWEAASAGLAGRSVQTLVASSSYLFAGTWGDGLFRSADNGRNWTALQGNLSVLNVSAVVGDPAGRDAVLLAAYGKGIFHTADAGRTWAPRQTGLSTEDIFTLVADPYAPTTIYALTVDGIFKSTDMGVKWQSSSAGMAQERPLAFAIAPSDSSVLYTSAGAGWVYRSDSWGERWLKLENRPSQSQVMALAVDPRRPSLVYAGSASGVYRSDNSGQTWQQVHDAPVTAMTIDARTGNIYAADTRGGVWRSDATALKWTRAGLDKTEVVTLAVMQSSTNGTKASVLFAGTSTQGVYISRDNGETWQAMDGSIPPYVQAVALHPAAPGDVLVATSNGLFVRTLDR